MTRLTALLVSILFIAGMAHGQLFQSSWNLQATGTSIYPDPAGPFDCAQMTIELSVGPVAGNLTVLRIRRGSLRLDTSCPPNLSFGGIPQMPADQTQYIFASLNPNMDPTGLFMGQNWGYPVLLDPFGALADVNPPWMILSPVGTGAWFPLPPTIPDPSTWYFQVVRVDNTTGQIAEISNGLEVTW